MCFIVTKKRAKIAKKNITCYKISFPYRYNDKKIFIPFYYHRYTYSLNERTKRIPLFINSYGDIKEGYHSFIDKENCKKQASKECRIGKFIIPKGVRYFENDFCYVSEVLIFKGYLKTKRKK
jgi:hypothetical protein